jgi:hypothetical protein
MTRSNVNAILLQIPPLLILSLPFIAFILFTQLAFNPIVDEHLFHLKTIEAFASSFPSFNLKDYPVASGPLPYILWTVFGKIFGFAIWKLRALTVFISYLGSLLFFCTCRDQKIPFPLLKTLILFFCPYIFLHSFTLYTINLTLCWELFSLRYFLKYMESKSKTDLTWSSIGALALVFSRQIDVALPMGTLCFLLVESRFRKPLALLGSFLPLMGLLLLFIYWNGVTPLRFQTGYPLSFKLTQLTLLLTTIGFYFQPVGLFEGWRLKGWPVLFFLLLIPYLLILHIRYPEEGLGIVYFGIDFVGKRFYSGLSWMLPLYLGILGGMVFYSLGRKIRESGRPPLASYVLLFYVILNCFNPFVYERYYYFAWPLILLLLPNNISRSRFLLLLVLAIHIGISLIYVKLSLVFPK